MREYTIFKEESHFSRLKAQFRHRNFVAFMYSLIDIGASSNNETIVQMAQCSFDDHLGDIFGTMMIGATLIILHPNGLIDLEYLCTTLGRKQITCMTSVPSLFHSLFLFVKEYNRQHNVQYMKSITSGGMNSTDKILSF